MAALWGSHFLFGVGLCHDGLPLSVRLAGGAGLIVSLWFARRRVARTSGLRILLQGDGDMVLLNPGQETLNARPTRGTVDLGWAIWLGWRSQGEAPSSGIILLVPDAVTPEDWRGLRIWLRFVVPWESGLDPGA